MSTADVWLTITLALGATVAISFVTVKLIEFYISSVRKIKNQLNGGDHKK